MKHRFMNIDVNQVVCFANCLKETGFYPLKPRKRT